MHSNLELQIEPIQPNQSSSAASIETRAKRGRTRGKGLRKMNKATGEKLKININVEKGRPINRVQSFFHIDIIFSFSHVALFIFLNHLPRVRPRLALVSIEATLLL